MTNVLYFQELPSSAPVQYWTARGICLAGVLLLHIILLAYFFSRPDSVVTASSPIATQWIDIPPVVQPRSKLIPKSNVDLRLESPPAVVYPPMPDLVISEAPVVVGDPMIPTVSPSPVPAGAGERSSLVGGDSGDGVHGRSGTGSGGSAFANCREVKAIYPEESVRRNEEGKVVLVAVLTERGAIESISVATSSGSRLLDAAAIAALKRWKCSPAIDDGHPVRVTGKQEFNFSITTVTKHIRL